MNKELRAEIKAIAENEATKAFKMASGLILNKAYELEQSMDKITAEEYALNAMIKMLEEKLEQIKN